MKSLVLVLAVLALAHAADSDVEEVSEDFVSAPGVMTARVVQNVKVFLNPGAAIPAKIVAHLPSHGQTAETETETETQTESEATPIIGDAFETSNFEANEVYDSDSNSLEASASESVEAEDASDMRFKQSSAPIRQMKEKLSRASAASAAPEMGEIPAGTPTDANVDVTNVDAPVVPLGKEKGAPAPPAKLMSEAEERASHLYIGYEDPNHLPTGNEYVKRPVDKSGTVGTPAGTDFDFSKKPVKGAKCANGCQLRVPVTVGYVGLREQPAESTRDVRMPGDRQRWRDIHERLKTDATWHQPTLNTARRHLKKAHKRIDFLRRTRKVYEDTQLNREVVAPLR